MKLKLLTPTATLLIIAAILTVATTALLSPQQAIPAGGTISHSVGIEIYNDANATSTCTDIDWGTLQEQSSITKTIYIKNTGNITETLSLETTNWNPIEATSMLTLTWDKEGASLKVEQIVAATLTLKMGGDMGIVDNFFFDIIIKSSA